MPPSPAPLVTSFHPRLSAQSLGPHVLLHHLPALRHLSLCAPSPPALDTPCLPAVTPVCPTRTPSPACQPNFHSCLLPTPSRMGPTQPPATVSHTHLGPRNHPPLHPLVFPVSISLLISESESLFLSLSSSGFFTPSQSLSVFVVCLFLSVSVSLPISL